MIQQAPLHNHGACWGHAYPCAVSIIELDRQTACLPGRTAPCNNKIQVRHGNIHPYSTESYISYGPPLRHTNYHAYVKEVRPQAAALHSVTLL